jgi:hypothetical protein
MAMMKLGNTPRPAAWSPSLASFPLPTLILATNSSNLTPHLVAASFWWKEVGRMIGCSGHRTRELQLDRDEARSKGRPNRARNPLGRSERAGWPRPFLGRFGPIFLPVAHLGILDFPPWFVSFWGRHPRNQDRGSSHMKSELYVLVLGDDPSYHLGPCHLWKWFLLALEHERNSSFAPLKLLWLRPFCPCFPAKTQNFQMHIRSWTCYIISVPSGGLVETNA